ncbi:hypothetical protein L0F63_003172 [Massospora cicadina]|nr:hypothetical protein L0F63_003172 [Massospora cicadina]
MKFCPALSLKHELKTRGLIEWAEKRVQGLPHAITKRASTSITQMIDLDNKLASVTTEKNFDDIAEEANVAYNTLLEADQSQVNSLQNELTQVKVRISTAKNNYFIAHPKPNSSANLAASPQQVQLNSPSADSLSGPIAKYTNLSQGLANAKSPADYDNLVIQINIAFQTLVAQNQANYSSLQVELESLKALIVKKKNASTGASERALHKFSHFLKRLKF